MLHIRDRIMGKAQSQTSWSYGKATSSQGTKAQQDPAGMRQVPRTGAMGSEADLTHPAGYRKAMLEEEMLTCPFQLPTGKFSL